MDNLRWLAEWFNAQCNGDWEHELGLRITSYDNPAIGLKTDLINYDNKFVNFKWRFELSNKQWGIIRINDSYIDIIASPLLLPQVINLFHCIINWLEDNPSAIFEWQVVKLMIEKTMGKVSFY